MCPNSKFKRSPKGESGRLDQKSIDPIRGYWAKPGGPLSHTNAHKLMQIVKLPLKLPIIKERARNRRNLRHLSPLLLCLYKEREGKFRALELSRAHRLSRSWRFLNTISCNTTNLSNISNPNLSGNFSIFPHKWTTKTS